MAQAKSGDKVKAHYTVKLDDGEVFQTSVGRKPLQFTIGDQQLIPAFEQALIGMAPGQSKTVVIAARDAFGEHRNDLVRTISREQIPDALAPQGWPKTQVKRGRQRGRRQGNHGHGD